MITGVDWGVGVGLSAVLISIEGLPLRTLTSFVWISLWEELWVVELTGWGGVEWLAWVWGSGVGFGIVSGVLCVTFTG